MSLLYGKTGGGDRGSLHGDLKAIIQLIKRCLPKRTPVRSRRFLF